MATANLALRFLTELVGVVAVGYAALQLTGPLAVRLIAASGATAVLVLLWAIVVAPSAANGLTQAQKDVIGTGLLLVAAGSLAVAGQPTVAIGFAVVVLVNTVLLVAFGTDAREALARLAP